MFCILALFLFIHILNQMPKITYIEQNGSSKTIEVDNGLTVMEGAVQNNIPGIDADCGGGMACATCHVYVEESWFNKLPAQEDAERWSRDAPLAFEQTRVKVCNGAHAEQYVIILEEGEEYVKKNGDKMDNHTKKQTIISGGNDMMGKSVKGEWRGLTENNWQKWPERKEKLEKLVSFN